MTRACPWCGHKPPEAKRGRPRKLDDAKVRSMNRQGWSLAEIAKVLKVSKGAVQASLKRSGK